MWGRQTLTFNLPFDQAIAAARARRVTLPKAFYALPAEKRAEAFTVSGLSALDQVQGVLDELGRQLQAGGTLADFKRWAATNDLGLPKHRLETIYRNAVQQAYNAGHWRRFEEDAEARPYLMYDAINDSRTRPAHRALDGVIRPVGDAFWKTHSPCLGHRCRCKLLSLSPEQARNRGGVTQNPPAEGRADEGWGHKPTGQGERLADLVRERQAACRVDGASFGRKRRDPASNIDCTEHGARLLDGLLPDENQAMLPPVARQMLDGLIARGLTARASNFSALWVSEKSLDRHVVKRVAQGDVLDAGDYERITLDFLAGAEELMLITPPGKSMRITGKLGIVGRDWLVLLSPDGGIVTSYQIKPGMQTVRERHILEGDQVEDFPIPDDLRKSLAAVFRRG